jgi:hypothetical protein
MHRAGAALRNAAAEFRAGHAEHVPQHPQQGHVVGNVDHMGLIIDLKGEHGR